jgi:Flp pilus assembly protein TadG
MTVCIIVRALKARALAAVVKLDGFRSAQEAVAAVEFALIMPLLLFLYIGSNELSQAIAADRRVTIVASTMGDLVARANIDLKQAELDDYFVAAEKILIPFPDEPLQQIVTSVSVDALGAVTVDWSVPHNGATAHVKDATYDLPDEMVAVAKGSSVIVSEASYSYEPLAGLIFKAAVPLYHRSFFIPRFGGKITIAP